MRYNGTGGERMYGLVLEGGGSKGSYQIGACKALGELGIEIGSVAGTSVGALNGAMVVQGDIDAAYAIWSDINPASIIRMPGNELEDYVGNEFQPGSLKNFVRRMRRIIADGGLDVEPLVELARSTLNEGRIRESSIGFGIVTVDITARRAVEIYKEDIPEGQLLDYIIASASFPAFKRVVIDGRTYIDGALYNVLPINMVSSKGFGDIIVLRTYGIGLKKRIDTTGLNIISISPNENLGPTLDFSTRTSRRNLKMGYYDAYRTFKNLKGSKFYILPMKDDSFFIHYLANMNEDRISRICGIFGADASGRRALFEQIVPRVANLLDLDAKASYEDVAVGLLERIAESLGVERFQFYSIQELYDAVMCRKSDCAPSGNESVGFLRSLEVLPVFARERMLRDIADVLFIREAPVS